MKHKQVLLLLLLVLTVEVIRSAPQILFHSTSPNEQNAEEIEIGERTPDKPVAETDDWTEMDRQYIYVSKLAPRCSSGSVMDGNGRCRPQFPG